MDNIQKEIIDLNCRLLQTYSERGNLDAIVRTVNSLQRTVLTWDIRREMEDVKND